MQANTTTNTKNADGSTTTTTWNPYGAVLSQKTSAPVTQTPYNSAQASTPTQAGPSGVYDASSGGYVSSGNAPNSQPYSTTAPMGTATSPISQQQYESEASMRLKAELQQQAEARRLGYLSTVKGSNPTVQRDVNQGEEKAARDAAFARAKEQAAGTAQASLGALRSVIENNGMMGSSIDAAGQGAAIQGAAGDVNEFSRDKLMQDLARASALSDQEYQGLITQRGQDMSLFPSVMGLLTAGAY